MKNLIKRMITPMTVTMCCSKCDEVHDLKVIKILSNFKKGKYVVWCNKKWKLDTIYKNIV